jgi:hypothetical protein
LATSGGSGGHAVVSGGRRSSYQLEALAGRFSPPALPLIPGTFMYVPVA